MRTSFQLNEHPVRVYSVHIGMLYGELYETTREHFNEYSAKAIEKFIVKLTRIWGQGRKWEILTPAPVAGEEMKFRFRDYSDLIVGAAWLESDSVLTDTSADGSHAFIVWIQKSGTEICLEQVLECKKWEEIAVDSYF